MLCFRGKLTQADEMCQRALAGCDKALGPYFILAVTAACVRSNCSMASSFIQGLFFKTNCPSSPRVKAEHGFILPSQIKRWHISVSPCRTATCKGSCRSSPNWLSQSSSVCESSNILADSYRSLEYADTMSIYADAGDVNGSHGIMNRPRGL